MQYQPQRGRKPKLDPNSETVVLGFKGTKMMKTEIEKTATSLGISYSEFLRTSTEDSLARFRRLREKSSEG